jgi:hypothetical protein
MCSGSRSGHDLHGIGLWPGRQVSGRGAALQLDVANVGPVREHLLTVINRGASVLIAGHDRDPVV